MMPTVTIRYQSPADDPFKVPRPHRFQIEGGGTTDTIPECEGGEVGQVKLLGFCPTETPDVDDWVLVSPYEVADPGFSPTELAGYFPQFIDGKGGMFGYPVAIKSIEVAA